MPIPPPRVAIVRYDERWPAEYERIAAALATTLADVAVRVDHIGSTSIPGLAAKDVIDVQVAVADLHDPRLAPALATLGATPTDVTTDHAPAGWTGPPQEWEKRYFRPPPSWRRTHLHVRQVGRANARYALLFRDFLRATPPAAAAYERLKVGLARLVPDDPLAYTEVKDPVCDLVMESAERWARDVRWVP